MDTFVQIAGSLFILVPFVLLQIGRLRATSRSYLVPNLVGSVVLAIDATIGQQWGFLLLEAVWALVALIALVRPKGEIDGAH